MVIYMYMYVAIVQWNVHESHCLQCIQLVRLLNLLRTLKAYIHVDVAVSVRGFVL